jgi:phage head maturation protease
MKITKSFQVKSAPLSSGEAYVVVNTDTLDRDGEVVVPKGLNDKEYRKNPIVLWMHDQTQPVGTTVSMSRMDREIGAHMRFAKRPAGFEGPFMPDFVRALVEDGVIRGASVSFEAQAAGIRNPTKADIEKYGSEVRRVFSHWKLLEWSFVSIGANPDALVVAAEKSFADRDMVRKWCGGSLPESVDIPTPRRRVQIVVPAMKSAPRVDTRAIRIEIARQRGALRVD